MNINKNRCCEEPAEHENSCLYVPTTTCLRCGKEVSLSPEELITHLREIGEGTYICPLCRLMSDTEKDDTAADDEDPENDNAPEFLERVEAFATSLFNLMILGSWIMMASKYGLPEGLVVEAVTRTARQMINSIMEEKRNDSDETESDSDEAAAACAGGGGANPPEGPVSGTAERSGSGIAFQADLRVQTVTHLIFRIQNTTT